MPYTYKSAKIIFRKPSQIWRTCFAHPRLRLTLIEHSLYFYGYRHISLCCCMTLHVCPSCHSCCRRPKITPLCLLQYNCSSCLSCRLPVTDRSMSETESDLGPALPSVNVGGYRFCRSDGVPFDSSITTFMPPPTTAYKSSNQRPCVYKKNFAVQPGVSDSPKIDSDVWYHDCDANWSLPSNQFTLANRCNPSWDTLSDQQKDVIGEIERETNEYRKQGIYFRSTILEGLGGCGKTRLMAYIMNHAPFNTHVLYLTKQNKRLQDFLYDDLDKGELIPPQPIVDMTKSTSTDFYALSKNFGGRYVCSVEKLMYNVGGRKFAWETNSRNALQWKMGIPDDLFTGQQIKNSISSVVVLLDEYTMISPPLLHKMLHCVSMLFDSPTVLIMGGDRFQLGPI